MAENMLRRFRRFVKLNERTLITVLLVILAPTFAFSFIMVDVFQDRSRRTRLWVGGRRMSEADWQLAIAKQRTVNKARWGFQYNVAEADTERVFESLMYEQEADRLGIRVSQSEFERRMEGIYKAWAAFDKVKDLSPQQQQAAYASARDEVKWDPAEYRRLVKQIFPESSIGNVEETLRESMRTEKLLDQVLGAVYVSDKDAYASWKEENEDRKLAFYRIRPDDPEILDQARREVTDEEIRKRYEEKKDGYRSPLRLRFQYVKAPLSNWDAAVTIADEDVREAYERDRRWRPDYRRPSVIETVPFDVLTEEERKAAEESQYLPLEEVKEQVTERLRSFKRSQAASAFMRGIVDEIQKAGGGAEPPKAEPKSDEKTEAKTEAKAEEKAAEPKSEEAEAGEKAPVDLEAIAKGHPELTYGVTPWFSQDEAEKVLGDLYGGVVGGFFRSAAASAEGKVGGRWPRQYTGKDVVCVALEPEIQPSEPLGPEEAKDIVRDEIAKERAGAVAESVARKKVEALREGKNSFEESAGTRPILRTERLRRRGPLKIEGQELPQATTERILDAAFAETGDAKIAEPVAEDDGGRVIVRIEEIVPPSPDLFAGDVKESAVRRLQLERQNARFQEWRAEVAKRYPIVRPGLPAGEEADGPTS